MDRLNIRITEALEEWRDMTHAELAETCQIHAGTIVQPGAVIGSFSIINSRASIDHDCYLEAMCHIGPGVTLSGNVKIGAGSHLGTGSTVVQGVTLGKHCFVAAGATVVRDVAVGLEPVVAAAGRATVPAQNRK